MQQPNRANPLRVVVVEDESLIAEEIHDRLANHGIEAVALTDSAETAIQAVEQNDPDLVLMDVRIKGAMDGIETASRIREQFHIPVVYLTAHSDQATLERAKQTSPFGYLLKPFRERELLVAIDMAINMHRLERQLEERASELRVTVGELERALSEIKLLRGLLPICAWCRKVRDDEGYWCQIETYLQNQSDVEVTHSICPGCFEKFEDDLSAEDQS